MLLLFLLIMPTTHAGKMQIRLKIKEGQIFKSVTEKIQSIEQENKDQNLSNSISTSSWSTIKVLKVLGENGYLIHLTVDSTVIKDKNQDTQNPMDKKYTEILSEALREAGLLVTIDSCWNVLKVAGFDKVKEITLNKVISELSLPPDKIKPILDNYYENKFNENSIKKMFEHLSAIYQKNAVSLGSSWKDTTTFDHPLGSATKYSTYVLSKTKDGNLKINFNATIKNNKPAKIDNVGSQKNLIEGSTNGYLLIDIHSFWTTEMIVNSNETITIRKIDNNNKESITRIKSKSSTIKRTVE